ncbi:similar to Saccharomyces cerevisiae YOR124C UBP2 Ubiquitin-specific protease that removes ubiquitin from ubiquitinated proteins [Maudiozyma barnettii]|uniref:Ubiquitin carboxyl-terminal hydrolase 2 n=1 Tax=Maudiozyma barnettii TaxID=61262 RepID=A0A8H2ZFR1_9SACH|nr:ubiquitin-specific protease UBP2 [Kazachstania barnettii]CAB4252035.1 similar to Saccharomyces cerevisiae YOR124C UBP2 Ubiquitin-specific protease that removes ubiquitin from ubiquitinated proteins [Kazachstania barnettii]CAD1778487.1 similar to Saccharomyces cerevisiae YOR124C UBP2 Ubiquitin-specific protease that removes ubiquitin from ubiquitinated proteins [Kazachstania barnettii]
MEQSDASNRKNATENVSTYASNTVMNGGPNKYSTGSLIDTSADMKSQTDTDSTESLKEVNKKGPELFDDGKHILYPELSRSFPMKTVDRLIDDIICDISFITDFDTTNSDSTEKSRGQLRLSPLTYSHKRQNMDTYAVGSFVDQISLQTKYEYKSVTCPEYNKINVYYGILVNPNLSLQDQDQVIDVPFYHLKISVKTRPYLETRMKQVGVTQYHLVENLHELDEPDFPNFHKENPLLVDYAIYASNDTNRIIIIEIFQSEFLSPEDVASFKRANIILRYQEAQNRLGDELPETTISPADCFNTMFKIFRGPLNRRNANDPVRTIDKDNISLNTHINPDWLISKYNFVLNEQKDEDTGNISSEYEPPELSTYLEDTKVRSLRDTYIRRCMELAFRGQLAIKVAKKDELEANIKTRNALNSLHTHFSISPLYQVCGESNSLRFLNSDTQNSLDLNFHFINLSTKGYYSDRDVIRNYETLISLDTKNIGIYYDALSYIANAKGAYQLVAYCGKQNIVGKEALDNALRVFKIDPTQVNIADMNEKLLLSIYKHESLSTDSTAHTDLKNAARVLAKYKQSDLLRFYIDYEPYGLVEQAYRTLEIDESVDDDIVQTAYSIKVNDAPGLKIDCSRALYTVAIHKRSLSLFNFLICECPIFEQFYSPEKYSYQEALNLLQVNENANDEVILNVFQQRWNNESIIEPDRLLNLKAALTKLGIEKRSKLIDYFLKTGTIDPNCLPPENWPTGLNNIGNTCYLNSLLQYYFSIAPLREYILDYQNTIQDFESNTSKLKEKRRIGGREVSDNEVERSIQFTYQLRDLFRNMIYTNSRCVTPTHELAYLAFAPSNVEVEFEITGVPISEENMKKNEKHDIQVISNSIAGSEEDIDEEKSPNDVTPNLIDMNDADYDMMKDEKRNKIEIKNDIASSSKVAKISTDQLENALEMGRQQDVTECIGNVLYQLESASEPINLDDELEQYDLIKNLFYGKTKQEIKPINDSTKIRAKYERFLSLLVNVSDHPRDIYDALDSSFKDELLTMDEYGDVKRTVSITSLPTILQVQIQRVYYDRERFMPFKSIDPVKFTDKLYMDRYVESDNTELLNKKIETTKMKQKLKKLRERQIELLNRNESGLSRKEAFMETIKFLKSDTLELQGIKIDDKEELRDNLSHLIDEVNNELNSIYNEINVLENKVTHQFDAFQDVEYTLFAVFIHRGEASYGHYWIYIKDPNVTGIWRKYNDETVTEVSESEVFNFTEGNTATPYFLVFVKEEDREGIEPLKRILDVPEVEKLD